LPADPVADDAQGSWALQPAEVGMMPGDQAIVASRRARAGEVQPSMESPSFQPLVWWVFFSIFVLAMLILDLGVIHRRAHEIKFKEALLVSGAWVALAMLFCGGLAVGWIGSYPRWAHHQVALEFLTGYLVEESLSIDNVFIFAVIFAAFAVPAIYQHRVLFYGILGAVILRGVFIFGGLWLIHRFEWMFYVFGAFLIITGIKMGVAPKKEVRPERNLAVRIARKVLPITSHYVDGQFITRLDGRLCATPLLLALVIVETTDVIFAADSIPAVLGITTDPFIVYTSNVFAILGLRALYLAVANFMKMFRYLSTGLSVLLVFIGGKMLVHAGFGYKLPTAISLGAIAAILAVSVAASVLAPKREGGAKKAGGEA
jgi:tellurite resistance protein TerC